MKRLFVAERFFALSTEDQREVLEQARAIHDGNAARVAARARHSAGGSVLCRVASDSWTCVGPIHAKARTAAPAGPLPKASIQRGACLTRTSDRPSFSFWVRPDVT